MSEAIRKFKLDAIMVNGQPSGVLKEDPLSGTHNSLTPNEGALLVAAMTVCTHCPVYETCLPKSVTPPRHLGIFRNTDLWIAGKMVADNRCSLANNGIPQAEYVKVMKSWDHS